MQIIGTKKCKEARKAVRFFKERGVKFHQVDLNERPLSPGELDKIMQKIPSDELIDSDGASYKKRGMAYMDFDFREEFLEDPGLLKTPIIRCDKEVCVGVNLDTWNRWLKS
ncbi:MAG: glutaredoxin [Spirochaetales bacterium]|nr:glutaredoxin [Spirochaetales bacterium]